jgi:methylmalonyl-CoA epimerase
MASAMGVRGIHHVGFAVERLAPAVELYGSTWGAVVEVRESIEEQGVDAVALRLPDGTRLELMAPLAEDTPVGRFLAKRGEGMHHIAYAVDDIEAEIERLRSGGANLIDEVPRHGIFGRVAFVHPESFFRVLTELVESEGVA